MFNLMELLTKAIESAVDVVTGTPEDLYNKLKDDE